MIKRIDNISNFGIFRGFNWSSNVNLEDFKEKNIIYGWNYSGKTTLSRIFSSIGNKLLDKSFDGGNFKFTCDATSYDSSNLSMFPYEIAVFNVEYIKENLRWEFDNNINAIFFEVGINASITAKIQKLNLKIDSINGTPTMKGVKERYQKYVDEFNIFEHLFSIEASRIKNEVFLSLIEFNKGHIKRIRDKIGSDLDKCIIKDKNEIVRIAKSVRADSPRIKVSPIDLTSNFFKYFSEINESLSTIPLKKESITSLERNLSKSQWVKHGLNLHEKGDNCSFCGSILSDYRYDKLINYFSNQASQLREKISHLITQIEDDIREIDGFQTYSINDFNDSFHDLFIIAEYKLDKAFGKHKKYLIKILRLLRAKAGNRIYYGYSSVPNDDSYTVLSTAIEGLNTVINLNNQYTDNFDSIVNSDRERFREHLVASYLRRSKYFPLMRKAEFGQAKLDSLNLEIEQANNEIARLNATRQSDMEGCAQFNGFIQSFLSRNDIEVKINNLTKKFNLIRGGELAKNLSEGEKMAISFSHFLVTLKGKEQRGQLSSMIIYVDDPISSLDSNHVFQINSLLRESFFEKIVDKNNPNQKMWCLKCRQLFISTHNLDFLNLLKEMPKAKGFSKKESRYFINRSFNSSNLIKLPSAYDLYTSEYHFLFSQILTFSTDPNRSGSPLIYAIPNILRRFTEMYTLAKYPNLNEEVDGRAEEVFGRKASKRILKVFHYFSHFNQIDQIGRQSNLIADIEHACDDLLNLIKLKDSMHYDALMASIK